MTRWDWLVLIEIAFAVIGVLVCFGGALYLAVHWAGWGWR
jgi:hypothetical protein